MIHFLNKINQFLSGRQNFSPLLIARSKFDYDAFLASIEASKFSEIDNRLLEKSNTDIFIVKGFCRPCSKNVDFLVDLQFGGFKEAGKRSPNWRERMVCPSCSMNNRQRLIASIVKDALQGSRSKRIYFMEQVTPIYQWALEKFPQHSIIGSEYLGFNLQGGQEYKGIRHEDVEGLSFADGEIDLIVSNDVFEHIPNPELAFKECYRVLGVGGVMLATIPFYVDRENSITRARLFNNQVENILEPQFHGNPISEEGSLVFTDFGWEVLNTMKVAGFKDVSIQVYSSEKFGHLGPPQLIFKAEK